MKLRKKRKFRPLGYIIFIGGVALLLIIFFVFDVWMSWMGFFLRFSGTFGLGEIFWGTLGLAAWACPMMFIPLVLALLFGSTDMEK